jgi:hypothetical protein
MTTPAAHAETIRAALDLPLDERWDERVVAYMGARESVDALVAQAERAAPIDAMGYAEALEGVRADRAEWMERATAAEVRAAKLEAALTPFVDWLSDLAWHPAQDEDGVEGVGGTFGFTYSDIARARAALDRDAE